MTVARSYYDGARTYYNWRAATAGTTDGSFVSGDAPGTVCPQQWTLPTRTKYVNLITTTYGLSGADGSATIRSAPLDFVYTGTYDHSSGSMYLEGGYAYYWSRTANSASAVFYLGFGSAAVDPQHPGDRGYGFAIRCLAKP